jgi:hypothetical protein
MLTVACDVEPLFVGQPERVALDTINRDFQAIARLGFDGVMLRHVDRREQRKLLDTAHGCGLRVALADRGIQHFARTGSLPDGAADHRDLSRRISGEVVSHPALASFVVEVGDSPRATGRGETLCEALGEGGSPCVLVVGEDVQTNADSVIRIDTGVTGLGSDVSPLELWLAQYHRGLAAGRTAGVVFDRYRRLPGDGSGVAASGDPSSPARTAAVNALATRAKLWGPRLQDLKPAQIRGGSVKGRDLGVTAFTRGRRRYVLVFNQSPESYTRDQVVLPESIGGVAVTRAVEVPPSRAKTAGRVIQPTAGRVMLPVALRPGDAALFELF